MWASDLVATCVGKSAPPFALKLAPFQLLTPTLTGSSRDTLTDSHCLGCAAAKTLLGSPVNRHPLDLKTVPRILNRSALTLKTQKA